MNERIIWQSRHDGLTHGATLIGNELDGYEVRSDCGLLSNACWEQTSHDLTAITCPRCRRITGINLFTPTETV